MTETDWLTHAPRDGACRAEEFGYRTDLPVLGAAASRGFAVDADTTVEVRVSPDRHQVVISHGGDPWVETVARFPDTPALPVLCRLPGPADFTTDLEVGCTVTEHSARGLRRQLRHLRETLDASPLAVAVQDPEEPRAVTAVSCYAEAGTLKWWSWRVLPESRCVVRTRARMRLAPQLRGIAA